MNSSHVEAETEKLCYENVNGSCTKVSRVFFEQIFLYIAFTFGIVVCVSGNLLVIISVFYFKQLHSPTHFLVMSLALVDFLLGFVVIPFSAVRFIESCWYFSDYFCILYTCIDSICSLASIFHLCFISIDRYIAVSDPLIYPVKFSVPAAGFLIFLSWVLAITPTLVIVYPSTNNNGREEFVADLPCKGSCQITIKRPLVILNLIMFGVPLIVMLVMYSHIFLIVKKQARMIENTAGKGERVETYYNRVAKREKKAAKTLGVAVGAFTTCWLPFCIGTVTDVIFNVSTPLTAYQFFYWLAYFNSALNPLIYAFFYPWFRETANLILTCKIFIADYTDTNLFKE
ncbi:trace amine-associated receptor 9-like [Protopterus annectens]|uniref:trace amine-associated receptor 9-like n=1 Tax=Protopterus annectens TaxID=7888 RepID=UPI001CFB371F|nr:trace amine-associated receptor 9-like [Protopterus annectens]